MSPNLSVSVAVLDIASIDVPAGRRKLDPAWVETLAGLFETQGQRTPIEVIERGERYQLVFGAHRIAAGKLRGSTIIARIRTPEEFAAEADITLAEITENLARRNLSALDRAVDIARWRELYEANHQLNKGGRKAKAIDAEELSAKFALSFSEAAQAAFGISRRSLFLSMKVASLDAGTRDRIALHEIADNQSELLQLSEQTAERQLAIAALLTADPAQATSVSEAVAVIDRVPAPAREPVWQKLAEGFSRMKEADQDRFFTLHEASIRRWLAGRQS